jgi:hypothetical protein
MGAKPGVPPRGRLSAEDVLYAAMVLGFAGAAARVWWLSAIVPAMDYPQFLVFVRAAQDWADPSSPFHGTYSVGPWFMPTSLPVQLTSALSVLCGHSIEVAGKVLLCAHDVGLVAASMYLLRTLGRSRWAIALVFPLIHSRWALVGGYVVFSTAMPLIVLGWALTVRWLRHLGAASGVALAACLCATLLWHGIGFAVLGIGSGVLWLLWRAPTAGARARSVVPAIPALALFAAWWSTTFGDPARRAAPPTWMAPADAAESLVEYVWASVPHATAQAWVLAGIVALGLVASTTNVGASRAAAAMWRVRNPLLFVLLAYLTAYVVLPIQMNRVEGVSNRFAYPAVLAFVFAWNLPGGRVARGVVLASILGLSAYQLRDITQRFRAFDEDTRGASALIDRIGPRATLYHFPADRGVSKDFAAAHVPLRELQQYATVRHGGLPNSSFAGYGINYVSYVGGRNPMPGLSGPPRWSPEMARFDYVLVRSGQAPQDARFRQVDAASGWELYAVCGSARLPECS